MTRSIAARVLLLVIVAITLIATRHASAVESEYFTIAVVDDQTGRGVPMVELRLTNAIRHWTDSNGLVAFHEPGLMGRPVYFSVTADGYEFPKDGLGNAGARLTVVPGGEATLKIKRINIAQRLYRVTGEGIYRDSLLVGRPVPLPGQKAVLNAQVVGCDSTLTAIHRGKIFWVWGDTNWAFYPLGNFHASSATSLLPADGGLDPRRGVDLEYFVGQNGFAKEMARLPGPGPTWLGGLVVLPDAAGQRRMFASYLKVKAGLPIQIYEQGLVEYNDTKEVFEKKLVVDLHAPLFPGGHAFKHVEDGVEYVYFAGSIPPIRVRATAEDFLDLSRYEALSCLAPGSRPDSFKLDRASDGRLRYAWKTATSPLRWKMAKTLIKKKLLGPGESLIQVRDVDTGKRILPHNRSIYWNAYRRRWIMIVVELGGSPSRLGEIWYLEADTPSGPWVYARKIVTHKEYSFYNPKQHPMFDQDGGRTIFFEGTLSTYESNVKVPVPRYDYNQIMYMLDLSDPRLVLPAPVYRVDEAENGGQRFLTRHDLPPGNAPTDIAFFAMDRFRPGTVPVYAEKTSAGQTKLRLAHDTTTPADRKGAKPLFYALPVEMDHPPATTALLYERPGDDGPRYEVIDSPAGEAETPLCRVWKSPFTLKMPWK